MGSEEESKEVGAYDADLLPRMIPYLDRHLIFPLVADRKRTKENVKFMYALLKPTNMTDYVGRLHKEMDDLSDVPPQYEPLREEVLKTKKIIEEKTAKIREVLADPEIVGNLRSDKIANMTYLKDFGVNEEMVADLWDYAQFHYNCGNYQEAAQALQEFRVLSTDNDKVPAAVWGRLACAILCTEWELALEEILKVKENIDQRLFNNPYSQLESRTWLIHWSLFPLFNNDVARDQLLELLFSPSYINTIQTLCPWVLRYLSAAVISNRTRSRNSNTYQKQLKDLIKIVRQEAYEYSDPVTDFVKALYVDFDFEAAQKCMSASEELLEGDFFLTSSADAFVESARHLISEVYCKIHQRIDIRDLSSRLGLTDTEGEKWIVNLIRETRVDAKIDYQAGTVEMNHPPQSVYQQVIERTKGAFFRTTVLSAAVAK